MVSRLWCLLVALLTCGVDHISSLETHQRAFRCGMSFSKVTESDKQIWKLSEELKQCTTYMDPMYWLTSIPVLLCKSWRKANELDNWS